MYKLFFFFLTFLRLAEPKNILYSLFLKYSISYTLPYKEQFKAHSVMKEERAFLSVPVLSFNWAWSKTYRQSGF